MNATKSATTSMPRTNGTAFQAMFKTGVLVPRAHEQIQTQRWCEELMDGGIGIPVQAREF
jgi:hypothetical protein